MKSGACGCGPQRDCSWLLQTLAQAQHSDYPDYRTMWSQPTSLYLTEEKGHNFQPHSPSLPYTPSFLSNQIIQKHPLTLHLMFSRLGPNILSSVKLEKQSTTCFYSLIHHICLQRGPAYCLAAICSH